MNQPTDLNHHIITNYPQFDDMQYITMTNISGNSTLWSHRLKVEMKKDSITVSKYTTEIE